MEQQTFLFPPLTLPPRAGRGERRNLVIEAGAGTGKTTAIVGEVLKLMIERRDLAPERIVLMTFTEKAAGEIADRIRIALEDLVHGDADAWPAGSPNPIVTVDADARRALEQHLANIDTLRSQTIHSFCQSLLRSFPIEAGLDPQFKIIEGFERSLLYGQVYDAWLDQETRVHPVAEVVHEWELLFAHAGYLFLIRNLILELIERRDLLEETGYDFGDFENDVLPRLADAIVWIRRDAAVCKDPAASRVADYVRQTRFQGGPIEDWIEYLQPIAASIRDIKLPGCGALKEPMVQLRVGGPNESMYDYLVAHRAAMALISLTRRFIAYLDEEKRKLGVVDFDDLLLRTLAVLDEPHVLARARAQFDFIFVDEFQDTDRTQARIIDRLARDESGAYVQGKTVVVGDPKQSIYGFRRADPETYHQMTQDLRAGGAEPRFLGEQYRSDAPLLDAVNAIFTRLFPELPHDPNVFRPAYKELHAARTEPRRELDARITVLHAEWDERPARFFAEAEAMASWIRANRDGGPRDLQRFAILFRRLTVLDDYLDTLRRFDIDYVLPPTRSFLDRRAPVDLLAVLRAIAYPFDRGAQISAARSPYFALTDEEIAVAWNSAREHTPHPPSAPSPLAGEKDLGASARREPPPLAGEKDLGGSARREPPPLAGEKDLGGSARREPSPLAGEKVPKADEGLFAPETAWAAFEAAIESLRVASRHATISELIDLVLATTDIERVYDAVTDGDRHRVHLERVRAIAFEYDQRQGGSVQQFVDEITRRRGEPEEMEPSLIDETQNAVRIMSVHAAKGLEFETVILPDLGFTTGGGGVQLFTVEEPRSLVLAGGPDSISASFRHVAGEPLKKIARDRDEAETLRLFYVAVTRAKTDVVFVASPKERKTGFQKALVSLLGDLAPPESGREVRMTDIGPVAFEKIDARDAAAHARHRLHDVALESDLAAADVVPVAIAGAAPAVERLSPGEIAAHRAGSRNKAAGILLHRALELWDGCGDVAPLLAELALEAAADTDTIARVRRRLATIASSEVLQRIARAQTLGREMPIRFVENGVIVERRIDRLIRENGRDVVIDYKSGAPEPARVEKDVAQVARYADAVAAMTGRECGWLLWYVDLDGHAVVES